jgi:hypothetical protein
MARALERKQTDPRMREPYHSIYLMWLARSSLADLIFSDGVDIDKQGRLLIKADPN